MPEYCFRIRFFADQATTIGFSEPQHEIELPSLQVPLTLRAYDEEQNIDDTSHLVLESANPFDTKEAALEAGHTAYMALLWCGLNGDYGFDLGDEPTSGGFGQAFREAIEAEGGQGLDDEHGLQVYECSKPTVFGRVDAEITVTRNPDSFVEHLTDYLEADPDLDASLSLALELANLAHFENSNRAQFLTRMLAVESVLPDEPVSDEAEELVDAFIDAVRDADLVETERASLVGSAGYLKQKSISRTGKELAERLLEGREYMDKAPRAFFDTAYNARSSLVHDGKLPDSGPDLSDLSRSMQHFTDDLLCQLVIEESPDLL